MKTGTLKKIGFTLAEVLITLAVVGVVAAMTLPTLIEKINDKVKMHQQEVITTRFVNGLNLFNTSENGLSISYETTYDFLKALSKYYKMTTICDANHLNNCFPYSKLNFDYANTSDSIDISLLKTKLKFHDNFLAPAGFISAGGTPFIVAFSSDCGALDPDSVDPDKSMSAKNGAISLCISGIYDLNGSRTPNKLNDDVVAFNGAKIEKYVYNDGKIKVVSTYAPYSYSGLDARRGTELYKKYKLSGNGYSRDAWVGAQELCAQNGGHLATPKDLADMVSVLYKDSDGNPAVVAEKENKSNLVYNSESQLAKLIQGFLTLVEVIFICILQSFMRLIAMALRFVLLEPKAQAGEEHCEQITMRA